MLVSAVATARVSSAVMNDATATTSSTRLRTTSEMSMPTDARADRFSTAAPPQCQQGHLQDGFGPEGGLADITRGRCPRPPPGAAAGSAAPDLSGPVPALPRTPGLL